MATAPQYIVHVKTAITNSGLNVNIQQDGTSLFLPIPRITREHREMLAKNAKAVCDKTKEKLRNIQNNYARDLKKSKDQYSDDLIFNLNETVLGTTKEYAEKAEKILVAKQQELLKS
jgi:ribosome recycling factor